LAIWQATRLVSSVLVTATKASQLANIGGAQGVKAQRVAADDRDIQRVRKGAAQRLLRLDDGHLMAVGQQALGKIHSHPAAAGNTNFHIITSFYGL